MLSSLLWFGTDYGPGDPMRWSAVAAEILLLDWIPRKIVADVEYLESAPDLLRAFVRFCHHERGIRSGLTDETIAAIDEFEPEYQQLIRSDRLQGPEALLAALGVFDDGDPDELDESLGEIMLDSLRRVVGGAAALDALDTEPLPDEPFAWEPIPPDVHGRVGEVLDLVERCCTDLLDEQYRTACRRLLADAAAGDPEIFRRRGRANTAAAAVCWIVGKTNSLFDHTRIEPKLQVKQLAAVLRAAGVQCVAAQRTAAAGDRDRSARAVRQDGPGNAALPDPATAGTDHGRSRPVSGDGGLTRRSHPPYHA